MSVPAALRSIAFVIIFYGLTVPVVLLAFPVAAFGRRPLLSYVRGWTRLHAWCCRWILGIRRRVEGEVPQGPVLIAAKHQAMFEAIDLICVLGTPAVVMKRQLADIPLWGWLARRYGAIAIDRSGGATALRTMMREAEAAIAEGRSLLIFPEGTRVLPGEQPPLQPGFAGLYRRFRLPVVPVALDSGRLWPRHSRVRRKGIVTMRFGEAIPPGLPRRDVELRVHEAINALEAAA